MRTPVLARHLMRRPVRTLVTSASVRDAAEFFLRHRISGAPVLDPHGRPVGVFTQHDLAVHVQNRVLELPALDPRKERAMDTGERIPTRGFHFEGIDRTTVLDLMTPQVVWVPPDAPLRAVVSTMAKLKIHRVFVGDGVRILGVITSLDVMEWLRRKLEVPGKPRANGIPRPRRRRPRKLRTQEVV